MSANALSYPFLPLYPTISHERSLRSGGNHCQAAQWAKRNYFLGNKKIKVKNELNQQAYKKNKLMNSGKKIRAKIKTGKKRAIFIRCQAG
ncbi:hypothetical protein COO59_11080 [Mixta theicola]|uniref:Uncharacterized protein n=1 Tax=Mixta theicola TaxID=1458355 RepID=A0A2K1Q941_9GAMM|nr:hypothetical protein [Mixta theicola]PNS11558.1 hypothetical protein COO59_11080 [Mixta theicola]GLR08646.1 hypothetical protein GCM10007905_13650 [Mixta theicola]